jgi:hypothetical protein
MSLKPSDLQLLADFLTGGTCLSYALRDSGALSVIAENGKKFLFSPDQVAWAQKQHQPSPKTPPKPARKPRAAKK